LAVVAPHDRIEDLAYPYETQNPLALRDLYYGLRRLRKQQMAPSVVGEPPVARVSLSPSSVPSQYAFSAVYSDLFLSFLEVGCPLPRPSAYVAKTWAKPLRTV